MIIRSVFLILIIVSFAACSAGLDLFNHLLNTNKMAIHIKDAEDLKNRLSEAGEKLVVIDFMATWCGPCKMIGPKLEEMAGEMADSIVVLKPINVPTAGAQAFPMNGRGRLGHDPPRGPGADWWVLTTADAAGTNSLK
ncbi:hypothetical protein evm_005376 [Chilo suppressalis]|nr:hypothetical protein evm_005376 [Chilo suppressalis]